MTKEKDPQKSDLKSRQSSLRYHQLKDQPAIPKYLKAVSGADEEAALADSLLLKQEEISKANISKNSQGKISIIMDRSSVFAVFLGATFLGVTSFIVGILVAMTFLQTPQGTKPEPTILAKSKQTAQAAPQAPEEKDETSLSDMALNLADQFAETPDEESLAETTGTEDIGETIGEAQESIEEVAEGAEETLDETPLGSALPTLGQMIGIGSKSGKKAKVVPSVDYFTLDLGNTDTEQGANNMKVELEKSGITEIYVTSVTSKDGHTKFYVRTGKYKNYNQARKALAKLPKPYSMWGKVSKDEPASPRGKS